jgi:hypothetical protein
MPYYTTATTATKCNRHRLLWMKALVLLVSSATPAFAFAPAAYSNVAATARVMARRPISGTSSSSTRIFAATTSTSRSPFTLPEGVIKTISKPGNGEPVTLGDIATVKYTCYLPGDDSSVAPFAKAEKQKLVGYLGSS